jgi:hypothetical protein
MMGFSRRKFLTMLGVAVPGVRVAAGAVDPRTAVLFETPPVLPASIEPVQPVRTDYAQLAHDLAELEHWAIETNHPRTWRRLYYTSALQLDAGCFCLFGVGDRSHVAAEQQRLARWFSEEGPLLGQAVTGDGRAWAIIVCGTLSQGLQKNLRRPTWTKGKAAKVAGTIAGVYDELQSAATASAGGKKNPCRPVQGMGWGNVRA